MALIYVVEDDKNIQEIETFALANVGYEVKGFDSAMDFYEALNDTTPDLILLDIMLPDEDGLSIVKKLRTRQDTVLVPVIMVTAKTWIRRRSSPWNPVRCPVSFRPCP